MSGDLGRWEVHEIPWWQEDLPRWRSYTINIDVESGILAKLERFVGIRKSRAVKYHPLSIFHHSV